MDDVNTGERENKSDEESFTHDNPSFLLGDSSCGAQLESCVLSEINWES